jgi:hypothetical protein
MKSSTGTRKAASNLSESLHRQLNMYALAATAAGVTALACCPTAEAEIIYTQTWVPIGNPTNLDLNNDGIIDFQFASPGPHDCSSQSGGYFQCATVKILPNVASNLVWGTNNSASALGSGVTVGSQGKFQPGHQFMGKEDYGFARSDSQPHSGSSGPWKEATARYLGLKFVIQGEVHYGWTRLSVCATSGGMLGVITGYAYETQPNTSIITGQKSGIEKQHGKGIRSAASFDSAGPVSPGLGTLASGSLGLQTLRANRK